MNFFQKIFAKKEIIRARRYDMACSEIDRWLASDPKAVMIIEHITAYVNDKSPLRPDKLREQLTALEPKPKKSKISDIEIELTTNFPQVAREIRDCTEALKAWEYLTAEQEKEIIEKVSALKAKIN